MPQSMIYERDVLVTTRVSEPLRANVYRPVGEGPFPTLVTMGPYGKDRNWADRDQQHARDLGGGPFVNWETPDPETWVPKGYAVVRVDIRGIGTSPGVLAPFSDLSAEDYYDAIEWAAAQPWSSGKVGLLGISFYAMTQWPVAALRPPHLEAMVPWEAAGDMYRDFMRAGGILNNNFLSGWWPNTVLNVQNGVDGSLSKEQRDANCFVSLNDAALERPLVGQFEGDSQTDYSQIEVPFLSVGNWGNLGLHLRGNVEAYLGASSKQKWLRIVVGDHVHPFYYPENVELEQKFLDYFLKGEDNGWADEPPVVVSIRDGDDITWRAEQSWPLESTQWTEYHLDAQETSLATTAPTAAGQTSYRAAEESITFSTPPLESGLEITGPVGLRLWSSSSTNDMDVFVRLGRIDPDGTDVLGDDPSGGKCLLAQGWLRASHRKLDPDKTLPYRPYHAHDEVQPLEPGEPVALDIEIWPTSMILPAGSRFVLEVGGSELENSYFVHDDPTDRPADTYGGQHTLYTGPDHSSYLTLPVIPSPDESV